MPFASTESAARLDLCALLLKTATILLLARTWQWPVCSADRRLPMPALVLCTVLPGRLAVCFRHRTELFARRFFLMLLRPISVRFELAILAVNLFAATMKSPAC